MHRMMYWFVGKLCNMLKNMLHNYFGFVVVVKMIFSITERMNGNIDVTNKTPKQKTKRKNKLCDIRDTLIEKNQHRTKIFSFLANIPGY